jgi:hypothetical protein
LRSCCGLEFGGALFIPDCDVAWLPAEQSQVRGVIGPAIADPLDVVDLPFDIAATFAEPSHFATTALAATFIALKDHIAQTIPDPESIEEFAVLV